MDDRIRRIREREQREREAKERRQIQEQNQRDRGLGFLIWVARNHARMSQNRLAKELRTSRPTVTRWEQGKQLPSIRTLEYVAEATGLELVVGLREREAEPDDFVMLAAIEDEGPMTELRLLERYEVAWTVPPTAWREKHGYEWFSDYLTS